MYSIKKAAVVGAGIMGHTIAYAIAQSGTPVIQADPFPEALENARVKIREIVEMFLRNSLLRDITPDDVLGKITFTTDIQAIKDVDIVFEAVPEKFSLKQEVFGNISKICRPDCIVTSNTSGTPITTIAELVTNPERVIGTHFFQPAHLIPLVEVIQTEKTAQQVIEATIKFIEYIGKIPAHIKKDVPGFVANRLQHALAREAMSLVQKGVVSSEDLDKISIHSFSPRMIFTGPLEQRDMNGLDTHIFVNEYLYKDLEDAKEPLQIIKDKVAGGNIGVKSGKGFKDYAGQSPIDIYNKKNQELIDLFVFLKNRKA